MAGGLRAISLNQTIGRRNLMKQHFTWILAGLILYGLLGMATFTQAQGGTWTKKADMPTARQSLSTSVVDGTIYAIGGVAGGGDPFNLIQVFSTVEAYDPSTDTWTKKTDMPTPRFIFSTSVVDGIIYAIGGAEDTTYAGLSTVEAYDPSTDTWTKKTDIPTPRWAVSTAVVNGIIYAIGGAPDIGSTGLPTVEAYNPATDTWTTLKEMPTPRVFPTANVVDGKIYTVGGGATTLGNAFPTVEIYNPATDTWTTGADMPTGRYGHSTGVVDEMVYAIGGTQVTDPWPGTSIVEAYDTARNIWITETDMPTARIEQAGAVVDGVIYLIGGGTRQFGDVFAIVEAFTPVGITAVSPQGKLATTWASIKQFR